MEIVTIAFHELKAFLKSGISSLLLLAVTTLLWGGVITGKVDTITDPTSFLWVIFFALVAGAGVTNTVFIRERLSGTFEILLTTGVERSTILWGKLLFTTLVSLVIGVLAFFVGFLVQVILYRKEYFSFRDIVTSLSLYGGAALLVSSSSAYLSLALTTPRIIQFMNFALLTLFSLTFAIIGYMIDEELSLWWLTIIMVITSLLFDLGALRLFKSEKIIQPLIY